MPIIKKLNQNKISYLYISIIIILIIFGLLLLLTPSQKNLSNIVTNTTTSSKTKNITAKNFYSNITIPDNFSIDELANTKGAQYSLYDQIITSSNGRMKIVIETVPTNLEKRINTGSSNIEIPYYTLQQMMVKIGEVETVFLYRENAEQKYFYATQEYERKDPNNFLTSDGKVKFNIFTKTNNPDEPYINIFKTSKNQEVRIYAIIDFSINKDQFMQSITELDKIISSLKI